MRELFRRIFAHEFLRQTVNAGGVIVALFNIKIHTRIADTYKGRRLIAVKTDKDYAVFIGGLDVSIIFRAAHFNTGVRCCVANNKTALLSDALAIQVPLRDPFRDSLKVLCLSFFQFWLRYSLLLSNLF